MGVLSLTGFGEGSPRKTWGGIKTNIYEYVRYVNIYIYTCIYIYIHILLHIYICVCMCVYLYIFG